MAHQSLYRRYRSRRFDEVKGQEQVVGALRNAVRDQRYGHAYLFSGPRGTGKTSTARILAKALNCEDLTGGEPCGVCPSCVAMDQGASYDLQELDAASNNGVEAVRDLISRVALGSPGRTKVYILDEVHMLSPAASNALLKTLEEPPPHVVFVLATTDPHKVLPTIRSRTQHFDFHLLPADVLEAHVRWVIDDAGLAVDDEGVAHVLRVGGGSARDTLSALDQVVAAGGVTAGVEPVERLVDAVVTADAGGSLRAVAEAVALGRDPRVLGEALLARLRDVFLHRMGGGLGHLTEGDRQRVAGWAEQVSDRGVTRALEAVGAALLEMRQAPDARIPLEVALVRITRSEVAPPIESLVARIEALEAAASGGAPSPAPVRGRPRRPPASGPTTAAPPGAGAPTNAGRPGAPGAGAPTATRSTHDGAPAGAAPATPDPPVTTASPTIGSRTGTGSRSGPAPAPLGERPSGNPTGAASARASDGPDDGAGDPPGPARGAAGARAALASSPGAGRGPRAGARASGPPRSAPAVPRPGRDQASSQVADPAPVAQPEAATTAGALPDRDQLTMGWADHVLPTLAGLTKAVFAVGRFRAVEDGAAVYALPNEVHRQKCEAKRTDVEAALERHFGRPVPLRLVVDEARPQVGAADRFDVEAPPDLDLGSSRSADPFDDEEPDVHELLDAPADRRTHLDRLTEAFPGAQLLEEDQ